MNTLRSVRSNLPVFFTRAWACLTGLLFAPAGAFGVMVLSHAGRPATGWLALVAGATVLAGFAFAVASFRAPERTIRWSFAHHTVLAVLAVAGGALAEPSLGRLALVFVVPACLVGIAVTAWLAGSVAGREAAPAA